MDFVILTTCQIFCDVVPERLPLSYRKVAVVDVAKDYVGKLLLLLGEHCE